jgi:hypothetical protein
MYTDRSAILSLVATGRLTPSEAERLLALARDREDAILLLALCLAFGSLLLPQMTSVVNAIGQTLGTLLPAIERTLLLLSRMA